MNEKKRQKDKKLFISNNHWDKPSKWKPEIKRKKKKEEASSGGRGKKYFLGQKKNNKWGRDESVGTGMNWW